MEQRNHYPPLPRQREMDFFRLLLLNPGTGCEPITCHLYTSELPDADDLKHEVNYEAVSYAWGPLPAAFTIRVGAWPKPVRENLWQLLHRRRHPTQQITLWIDALCIDQADDSERAYQVRLMDRIFRGAQRVLVWLGTVETNGTSSAPMSLIKDMAQHPSLANQLGVRAQEAILAWARLPYWTRTWVVQEFLLAQDLIVVYGDATLEWTTIAMFLHHLEHSNDEDFKAVDWLSELKETPAYILMHQRSDHSTPQSYLSDLLIQNCNTECLDPRDRVYAMLGLSVGSESERTIRISYRKNNQPLLIFEILNHCQIAPKDVARYVRFLAQLLEIKLRLNSPSSRLSVSDDHRSERKLRTLEAFRTGTIVSCHSFRDSNDFSPSTVQHGRSGLTIRNELRDIEPVEFSKMLCELDAVSLPRLRYFHNFWSLIGDRTWEENHEFVVHARPLTAPRPSLVIVFTSGCVDKEQLLGVGYGQFEKDDIVLHQLGHPNAIVMRRTGSDMTRPRLVGQIICSKRKADTAMLDMVTRQPTPFYTIQCETDCVAYNNRVSLRLTHTEILKFAQ